MKEIRDFLGDQAPYDRLSPEDLDRLAAVVEVEFFAAGEEIIAYGAERLDHIHVIRNGVVEVLDRGRVVDVLSTGDTFGHVAVLSGLPTAMSVRAAEDTISYRLPDPRSVVAEPDRLKFAHFNTLVARERLVQAGGGAGRMERGVREVMMPVCWCDAADPVRAVARRITDARRTAAIMHTRDGLGIVTDDDFRRRVATGEVGLDAPIVSIASTPAKSVRAETTQWAAYLEMVGRGIHHLVVAQDDGTPVGIVGIMDLAGTDVRHPLVIRSAITGAGSLDELQRAGNLLPSTLVELWDAGVSSLQIAALKSAIVEAVLERSVEFTPAPPEVTASWVVTGSVGRAEPLPESDVDTALVWSTAETSVSREDMWAYAAEVLAQVEKSGLDLCDHDANASFPLFNHSVAEWRGVAAQWQRDTQEAAHLIVASAMLDARVVTHPRVGSRALGAIERNARHRRVVRALTGLALQDRPPVGFAHNAVVERLGRRRKRLDLKRQGLRPIVALARVLSLGADDTGERTTRERLRAAADRGAISRSECDTLSEAYSMFHELLTESSIEAIRAGRPAASKIDPGELDPLRRRNLREAFRALDDIQESLGAHPDLGIG